MLLFGEMIEMTVGAKAGLSTMAAAAVGNLFSDVTSIGFGKHVENMIAKLGLGDAKLSPEQEQTPRARSLRTYGSMIGIGIGCILGMWPLLVFGGGKKEKDTGDATSGGSDLKTAT